jgi:tyrosine-protein kinase
MDRIGFPDVAAILDRSVAWTGAHRQEQPGASREPAFVALLQPGLQAFSNFCRWSRAASASREIMNEKASHNDASLRDYLQVLRRRGWLVLAAVVLVPTLAVLLSLRGQSLYQSKAQVLLSHQNLASSLTMNVQDPSAFVQADRLAQTQANVARVPEIARSMLERLGIHELTPKRFLADSSVSAGQNSDILTFKVTNHDPLLARRMVEGYAREYTRYRRRLDTAALAAALAGVTRRLGQLERSHQAGTALYGSLVDRQEQLATMEALQTSNAFVVEHASVPVKVAPTPTRNGILGLLLGIVLGVGLAFLWDALDTRIRNTEEIAERLGVPLLARLPEPPRRVSSKDWLSTLAEPRSASAEAFRMLRTNLEFVLLDRNIKTIMVTSSVEREGKSTTVANLAVALAHARKRVAVVDLDLRRPYIHRFFDLEGPGLTDVALGRVHLNEALAPVAVKTFDAPRNAIANGHANGNGHAELHGRLDVLPSGVIPPDPGEFVGRRSVAEIVRQLAAEADIVLVDAPPVLHVGDAIALSAIVDAVLVVTRMKVVRRNMLVELALALSRTPVPTLGFVVTGAQEEPGYGYGYGYGYPVPYASQPETAGQGAAS